MVKEYHQGGMEQGIFKVDGKGESLKWFVTEDHK